MKTRTLSLLAIMLAGALILSGCNKIENNSGEEQEVGMANPASVYCEENGGTLKLEEGEGLCMFDDGSYCEEWSYQRGECQPGDIFYNTVSDEENIDDVEVKLDWNGDSETYSREDLQAAVDKIADYLDVKVDFQQIFYQGDEESANQLSYCKELNPEVDECVLFKTDFFVPEQDATMAGAFEPNTTINDYEWYLGRTAGGEWNVLTAGY